MFHEPKLQVFQLRAIRWFLALPGTGLTREQGHKLPLGGSLATRAKTTAGPYCRMCPDSGGPPVQGLQHFIRCHHTLDATRSETPLARVDWARA